MATTPTPLGQRINRLIQTFLHPALKPRGFRRNGRHWNRDALELVHVIGLQSSALNLPEWARLTVNVGVYVPAIAMVLDLRPPHPFIAEPECHLHLRLGHLMPECRDRRWDFDEGHADLDQVGREVTETILAYAVPFLDPLVSLTSLRDLVAGPAPPHGRSATLPGATLAVLEALLGTTPDARYVLLSVSHRS